ncbi:MAG: hypothetical protein OHK0053_07660 [Microscillaceae bacterium]
MNVSTETLQDIANLARLALPGPEEAQMLRDLNQMLEWVALLDEIEIREAAPLTFLDENLIPLREDEARPALLRENALRLAPHHDGAYFRVPRMMD